jgi:hypothetical protein
MSRRTLADANAKREWRIYADFCQILSVTLFEKVNLDQIFANFDFTFLAFLLGTEICFAESGIPNLVGTWTFCFVF